MFPICDQCDLLKPDPTAEATIATTLKPPCDHGDLALSCIHFKKVVLFFRLVVKISSLDWLATTHTTDDFCAGQETPMRLNRLNQLWSCVSPSVKVANACNRSVRPAKINLNELKKCFVINLNIKCKLIATVISRNQFYFGSFKYWSPLTFVELCLTWPPKALCMLNTMYMRVL